MHSSRMRTARSLTVCRSRSIYLGCVAVMQTPYPLPCTPPTTHAPPLSCMPLAMHIPLPCMPPTMHTPNHATPSTHAPTMHAPPPVDRITDVCENITLLQLRCGR